MTPQEAIEIIESDFRTCSITEDQEATSMAINALEKQILKKIENEGVPSETFVEELKRTYAFEHVGICPNCNYINIKATAIKCCCNCGQAIDWSGDR